MGASRDEWGQVRWLRARGGRFVQNQSMLVNWRFNAGSFNNYVYSLWSRDVDVGMSIPELMGVNR